jgi:maltooligosyltrehalose trehalohydrolase
LKSLHRAPLGATWEPDGRTRFSVWAPVPRTIELHLVKPRERLVPLERDAEGYAETVLEAPPGTQYYYRLDGSKNRPDPASRAQPEGVHGPSQVVDPRFEWADDAAPAYERPDLVFYELHVGTFTQEGTFDAAARRLPDLVDLGITAVELMPVHQFPGDRNWGYDGVQLYAAQSSYGGCDGLKRFVRACHRQGLAAVLDVVYNHFGPEGNYLPEFGPYYAQGPPTQWGHSLNFDGPGSPGLRRFIRENAAMWVGEYRFDALRLDAAHAIRDRSSPHFLVELGATVRSVAAAARRRVHVIAEDSSNDAWMVETAASGGHAMDAAWRDDFHHALYVQATRRRPWRVDYRGLHRLAAAYQHGFVQADILPELPVGRPQPPRGRISLDRYVLFLQNHDQVANVGDGERWIEVAGFESAKASTGLLLLGPHLPLLFMGQEYGEPRAFQYFISHSDPDLVAAVRRGRAAEHARSTGGSPGPDPQDPATFEGCRLQWHLRSQGRHAHLWAYHQALLRLRRTLNVGRGGAWREATVAVHRRAGLLQIHIPGQSFQVLRLASRPARVRLRPPAGTWRLRFDSASPQWLGHGPEVPERLPPGRHPIVTLAAAQFLCYQQEA